MNPAQEKTRSDQEVISIHCPQCGGTTHASLSRKLFQCQHCGTSLLLTGLTSLTKAAILPLIERTEAIRIAFRLTSNNLVSKTLSKEGRLNDCTLVFVPLLEVRERALLVQKEKKMRTTSFGGLQRLSWIPSDNYTFDTNIKFLERYVSFPLVYKHDWGFDYIRTGALDWRRGAIMEKAHIVPYDPIEIKRKGVVLDPPHLDLKSLDSEYKNLLDRSFSFSGNLERIDSSFRLLYYPIWLCRLGLRNTEYTISIDGLKGDVLEALLPQEIRFRPLYAIIPAAVAANLFAGAGHAILTGKTAELIYSISDFVRTPIFSQLNVLIYIVLLVLGLIVTALSYFWIQFRYQSVVEFTKDTPPHIIKINKPPKTFLEQVSSAIMKTTESLLEAQLKRRRW